MDTKPFDIYLSQFDFLDFGASNGGSIDFARQHLGGDRGLGIDIHRAKVSKMRERGYDCVQGDITRLALSDKSVRFVIISHLLEHLPNRYIVKKAIENAARVATDFLYIQGPFFDADGYLRELGMKYFYSDWAGHTCHLKTTELRQILRDLGLSEGLYFGVSPTDSSADPFIHPFVSPQNQQKYDSAKHPAKEIVDFKRCVYKEMVAILPLRDEIDIEPVVNAVMKTKAGMERIDPNEIRRQLDGDAASSDSHLMRYKGYSIPIDLVRMTGGPPEKWEGVIESHFSVYHRFAPIRPEHNVVEIGCGVGRDAIPLTEILRPGSFYLGVDVLRESIDWCRENITDRHPNFHFVHYDIFSQGYNPRGAMRTRDITLPVADGSVDRFILQSVFTHLFEEDITHYMREFARCLRPEGLVVATCFIQDEETLDLAEKHSRYKFRYEHAANFRINDPGCPERAVSFSPAGLDRMLGASGLELSVPLERGAWSGRKARHFQDLMILRRRNYKISL